MRFSTNSMSGSGSKRILGLAMTTNSPLCPLRLDCRVFPTFRHGLSLETVRTLDGRHTDGELAIMLAFHGCWASSFEQAAEDLRYTEKPHHEASALCPSASTPPAPAYPNTLYRRRALIVSVSSVGRGVFVVVVFQELAGGGAVVGGWGHQYEIQHTKKTKPQSNPKRHQNLALV
ncbi:hypothetical protein BDZ89DRAFT_1187996 [Hymenopellis radicata]|nr:hypothetical protein BDZ89DRAFT_1187996 [Hymenopellis radicata]